MNVRILHRKRALRSVLVVLLLFAMGMTKMFAYDFSSVCETGQTLYYNITDATNHYVELTCPGEANYDDCWWGYNKPSGNIILPESVQYDDTTYSVTSIGDYTFYNCSDLTGSLTLPNSVTSIGNYAFNNCRGFTGSLSIPNSVTSIGNHAFYNCSGFTGSLSISNSVTSIGDYAFAYCSGFTGSLTIPNSVTTIEKWAFSGCSGFTGSLAIGNSVTSIGYSAFSNCSGFTDSLTLPNSVTIIGDYAFVSCNGLTSLTIPNSVTSIGIYSFAACSGLKHIEVASGNTVYDSRGNCNAIIETNSNELISGCMNSIIPNSVTTIGNYAFLYCNDLTSLTIPNSVTTIGEYAFYGCSGFTSMSVLAETPPSVESYAFYNVNHSIPVTVPCGTMGAYQSAVEWNQFTNYIEDCSLHITAMANPAEGGMVTGAGTFEEGDTCTLIASPNEGYFFVNWMENGNVISTETTYSFIVEGNRSLMANFANVDNDNLVYNGDFELGNVGFTSSYQYSTNLVPEGTYYIGENANNYHNGFIGMAHGGTGNFMIINGATEPGINVWTEQVTVIPNTNYAFSTWVCNVGAYNPNAVALLQFSINGVQLGEIFSCINELNIWEQFYVIWNSGNSTSATITILNQNTTPMGNDFGLDDIYFGLATLSYSINAMPNPVEGGSVTGVGTYQEGTTCTLTATANTGYYFVNWTKDGEQVSSEVSYSFTVTENAEYVAHFECYDLGDFTYMSPTDNYPFTSLPITFSWDAVSGAEYYDLYVWDAEEQMPDEPFVSNLRYGSYSTSDLQNYHTYNWLVKARNVCYEVSSSEKSFYLDIMPSLNVNVNQIDFGEVAMNESTSTTLNVTGIVLEDELEVQITGDDASMFSITQASSWNDYNGGILIVTFNPTTPQYDYNANLVVSSGTFIETVTLTGAVSDLYVFNTYVTEDVYAMNTQIPIYGSVTDWNNAPVADVEVEIGVFVMGMKRTLQAMTNANGQFSAVFEPMPSESGYYTVNSGRIGNHSTAVHDDFNIPGMAVVTSDYILCAVTQDQTKTDSILIRNKSNLPLSNIQLQTLSAPEGCTFSFSPMSLGGLEEDYLVYTVTGSTLTQGNYYEEVRLKATSSEGAETVITVWYYCMEPRGVLDVLPKALTTTMTKGKSKIVDVMLTNNGTTATGNIAIDLPDVEWMSVVGNDTLPSLAVNDTAYFSLRFSPAEDIQLGQYSGTIAINSERGDTVALPYTITAVSDSTGSFVVDVTDDFTWNTNNRFGPHLANAEVTLTGYYSLETMAYGYTDADGLFQIDDLPEGYYRLHVEAERHTQYDNVILITAGETNNQDIYLQYQPITYSWTVEPTEIPDEYTYELNVVYETHVPVPVITIEHSGIHDLEYGESANFNLVITNHGLISAFDTHIYFTESSEYTFVPLYDIIDTLQALTTIVIPGTYYRTDNRMRFSNGDCDVHCLSVSVYYCNMNGGWSPLFGRSKPFPIGSFEICRPDGNGGGGGFPGMNVPNLYGGPFKKDHYNGDDNSTPNVEKEFCTPCIQKLASALAGCIKKTSLASCLIINGLNDFNSALVQGSLPQWEKFLFDEVSCLFKGTFGKIFGIAMCLKSVAEISECVKIEIHDQVNNNSRDNMGNIQNTIDGLYYSSLYYSNEFEFVESFFPGEVWETEENISEFFSEFTSLTDSVTGLVPESAVDSFASSFIGTSVTYDDIINFVNRWNRSFEYWSNGYLMVSDLPIGYDTNFIQIDTCMINYMIEIEDYYASIGYESIQELYEESVQNATIIADNASQSSICASVTVRFSQNMTMTREAFDGTFTVHNGHDTEPMEAIGLEFLIKDEDGNDCTNLFQINTTSLNTITGIDGTGSLDAGLDGVAKFIFIPTKNAAPTEPKLYYFGGTFFFIDPYTSEEIVYDLYPVEITVNPSPDLYVDYFMQRDILGDDALTLDVVEPIVPAELGVIIHNQGAGMAKNVILETAEPQIIDNEKGLAINFAMYGASFNGSPRQLGLMEIPFGNIGSGQTAVGEWLFTSSLLGHFVSYEAHVIHNSSYGNSDLSLVSHLDIHELIHPIYAYGNLDDGINDFLVNDNPDAYDTPDSIYFSHGGKTSVGVVDNISFDHSVSPLDTIVTLTIVPSRVGWNYGVMDDPGMNQYNIVSCIRNNDNQVIPLNNVWQTFVTIPDGGDPVYENKLHIVDTIPVQQTTTYTLVLAKKPSNLRIFHGNEDEYWSNVANWEDYIMPQADDEVLIDGICQLDQDAEVFSLTVAENQSLTIPEDRILTVSGMLTSASVSRLIIEEGGQLFHGNTGVQATVQKTIMPYTEGENDGWYFIASPLAGSTSVTSVTNMLDNEYDLYYYDEPTAYWMNQEYAPNGFSELVNGKGYLYANSEEVLLGFAGELQSGSSTVTVFLNYTEGGDLQGFNLVGNPFVYNLNSYASVNVANGCYQLNEAKDDLIVNEINEANPLKPAEGFFVKATDEGASITFNPGRGETTNRSGSIRVELLDDGKLIDRLIVKIDGEPLEKMSLKEQRTKLFAMQGQQEIAIVPCVGNEQPVSFKAAKNGEYTLTVKANGMEFDYLHLIDNLTGADVDLLVSPSYTFEAETTDYASRFLLRFIPKDGPSTGSGTFAFISNGNIVIIGVDAHTTLQIVDVLGHVLVSKDGVHTVSTSGMAKGVYVLRLINGDEVRTQKIVVR